MGYMRGSCYNRPKTIFYLFEGDYKVRRLRVEGVRFKLQSLRLRV